MTSGMLLAPMPNTDIVPAVLPREMTPCQSVSSGVTSSERPALESTDSPSPRRAKYRAGRFGSLRMTARSGRPLRLVTLTVIGSGAGVMEMPLPSVAKPSSRTTSVCQGSAATSVRRAPSRSTTSLSLMAARSPCDPMTLPASVLRTVSSSAREAKNPRQRRAVPRSMPAPASTSVRWRARPRSPLAAVPMPTMIRKVTTEQMGSQRSAASGRPRREATEKATGPAMTA